MLTFPWRLLPCISRPTLLPFTDSLVYNQLQSTDIVVSCNHLIFWLWWGFHHALTGNLPDECHRTPPLAFLHLLAYLSIVNPSWSITICLGLSHQLSCQSKMLWRDLSSQSLLTFKCAYESLTTFGQLWIQPCLKNINLHQIWNSKFRKIAHYFIEIK